MHVRNGDTEQVISLTMANVNANGILCHSMKMANCEECCMKVSKNIKGAIIFYREEGPSVCGGGGTEFLGVVDGGGPVFFFSVPKRECSFTLRGARIFS